MRLHTLSPPMLPLPKTLLEGFFWNGVHLRRRVLHYLFSTLKTGSFQCRLQFRKHPEVARSHVWRVGRLVNDWNSMFRQEILDQVRWMCWSIVMMQLPVFRRPEVWSFAPNCITDSAENLLIILFFVERNVCRDCMSVIQHQHIAQRRPIFFILGMNTLLSLSGRST